MYYILNINLMVYVYNLINIIFILSGLKIIRFSYLYSKFVQKIIQYTINACNYDVHRINCFIILKLNANFFW
jgi:hypothetical protein